VAKALASYERTLIAGGSPFDKFFYGHDHTAIDTAAERGLALFRGAAQCSTCHTIGQEAALFSDNRFHSVNVGLPRSASKLPALTTRVVAERNAGARMDETILSDPDIAELGRFVVTLDPADIGKFRTPSLRNVALTAPYMHDGSVATLHEAVDRELYDHVGEAGRPLILTPHEKSDLVDFLKSLTSPVAARSYKAEVPSP
jgi:cytochrome c peroxidase